MEGHCLHLHLHLHLYLHLRLHLHLHLHLSCSLADLLGTAVDFTTNFLHSSRFSAFRSMLFLSRPIPSHRFLCLPLRLPLCTVPCRIVLASPDDLVTCPYHFSLCLFTEVRRSSYSPWRFQFWFSLPHWLCGLCTRYPGLCGNISSPMPAFFFQRLLL